MAEPTLATFYAICDSSHREFYSVLIREWQELGLSWVWTDENVALCGRSVARGDENGMVELFVLKPGRLGADSEITVNGDHWRNLFGQEEIDLFLRQANEIPGLDFKTRGAAFSMLDTAHASGPTQQRLRNLLQNWGRRLPDILAA